MLTKVAVIIYLITSGPNQGVKSFDFKTIQPRCFLGDKNNCRFKHNSSFIQYHFNMFRPNGTSSGCQECKINARVYLSYILANVGQKHVELILNKWIVVSESALILL
jgi:hypothetical protein